MSDKHPLDELAERLEEIADGRVAAQDPSPDYWELDAASDASVVGDYPQAVSCGQHDWGESEGLGLDGFPCVEIPEQRLQPAARLTDVLSANLWDQAFLFNEKALAVFKQCDLGNFREYPTVVRDQAGAPHAMTYLRVRNLIEPTAVDFGRSEFYVADRLGKPGRPVAIASFEDLLESKRKATAGKLDGCQRFSKIEYKRLVFRPGEAPSVDFFTLARLGIREYISARLKDAIVSSGITGLEVRPNKRLFAGR